MKRLGRIFRRSSLLPGTRPEQPSSSEEHLFAGLFCEQLALCFSVAHEVLYLALNNMAMQILELKEDTG